jgi:hypothetical protein
MTRPTIEPIAKAEIMSAGVAGEAFSARPGRYLGGGEKCKHQARADRAVDCDHRPGDLDDVFFPARP